jgi:ABC-type uncharacterized transport system substrate-binding protein
MRRREFIGFVGVVLAWPRDVCGQQAFKTPRMAMVHPTRFDASNLYWTAFFSELARHGLVEDKTLVVERFSGEGRADRFSELAQEVVRRRPDVIFALTSGMVLTLKAATDTIPIVGMTDDPIARGIASVLQDRVGTSLE